MRIANLGYVKASFDDAGLAEGVNLAQGRVTYNAVAETFKLPFEAMTKAG